MSRFVPKVDDPTGEGSSRPQRREGSRWGGGTGGRGRGDPTSIVPPPHPNDDVAVSDDEALRALLVSAQEREQQQKQQQQKQKQDRVPPNRRRGRDHEDPPRHSHNDNHNNNNNPHKVQRLEENNSYYGPRGGGGGGDDERGRGAGTRGQAANIEQDDNINDKPSSREGTSQLEETKKPPLLHKPNFGLSGALAKDPGSTLSGGGGSSRVYKGVVLKFQEPPEARAPNTQWRLYVFKDKEMIETLHISKQSAYLCGRHPDICDISMAHPSLSSQHAVLQYRALPNKEGRLSCQPYLMDLESTNGTFINGIRIDSARYYQLKKGDVLTFGASKREYVLLTENTTALR